METKPKIFIGADHNGFELKTKLMDYLKRGGYDVTDCGDKQLHQDDDFPQFASYVVQTMIADESFDVRGILICGSGQGMVMAANRFKGIRAALGYDHESARSARNDDDSNILAIPSHALDFEKVVGITETWLMTPFAGATRFKRRIQEMDLLG